MDSSGHVLWIDQEKQQITGRSEKPMPDPYRGVLVLKALDAGAVHIRWWPELAALTEEERVFVREELARSVIQGK